MDQIKNRDITGIVMEKCKVALIHNIVAPYRIPVFEELANNPLIDFKVFYCAKTHRHRNWEINTNETYDYRVLSGICIRIGDINYHINLSIVWELSSGRYDVVIIGGCSDFTTQLAFFLSKFTRIPLILWSEGISGAQSRIGRLISPLTNYMISNADAIVVPGELSRQYHIDSGALPERIFVGPSIVDNDFYMGQCNELKPQKDHLKVDRGIPQNKVILYVGQIIERKGLQFLLSAYKMFKHDCNDACLVLVGEGPLKDTLENTCIEENIDDVIFTGWVSEKEKAIYYSIADVFILPTLEDVWGLVVNEAMCCGLPIITTSAAGCSIDLVENDRNGYIVKPKNVDEIYQALFAVFENPTKAERMGEISLEIIQKDYLIKNTVNGFLSAIGYVKGNIFGDTNDVNSETPMTTLRD